MDKNEKVDLRVVKTHLAIQNALIALLNEKAFRDIQVQEIIERAMINRSTFYKYYRGKSDLAGKLIAQVREQYQRVVQERFESQNLRLFMQKLTPTIEQHAPLLLALWKIETKRHHLWQDMHAILKQAFLDYSARQTADRATNRDFQATMFATLALESNRYYFEQGKALPLLEVFDQWQEMVAVVREES